MLVNTREDYILKKIEKHGQVRTLELSQELGVSAVTIRHDLHRLDKEGRLVRTHGGAVGFEPVVPIADNFNYRHMENGQAKEDITEEALKYVKPGQTIMLDASSTCLHLARKLGHLQRLTVVTNGIYTMLALKEFPNITTILVGGIVTNNSASTEGTLGKEILDTLNIDVAFTSSHSLSLETGLADFNFYEVQLKSLMLQKAQKIIALVDSSKFNKGAVSNFCTLSDLSAIITDNRLDMKTYNDFANANIQLTICDTQK